MTGRHVLERAVFAASGAAVVALVALLIYDGLTRTDDPRLTVTVASAEAQANVWIVPIVVQNDGGTAAANVDVEVALTSGRTEEHATVTLPFVPQGSSVDAAVTFTDRPSPADLEARVLGYEVP